MRIDVRHPSEDIERELASLHARLHRPSDRLHGMTTIATDASHLRLRIREADGEYYVYVEDTARRRLAGYTVFNRLIELGRRLDRHLRAPHSKYAPDYQRCGLASGLYRWALDGGQCLLSGARQSSAAHALWQALGRSYGLGYVDLRDRRLRFLGRDVSEAVRDDLHTRMLLLGRGWSVDRMASLAGIEAVAEAPAGLAPAPRPDVSMASRFG
jgi:hypothetical protein